VNLPGQQPDALPIELRGINGRERGPDTNPGPFSAAHKGSAPEAVPVAPPQPVACRTPRGRLFAGA